MAAVEVEEFLRQQRIVTCGTIGPRGWPHLMPLWYALRRTPEGGPQIWAWTYGASQKVRNLERDPRVTLQVEAGLAYHELQGVVFECEAIVHRDQQTVQALGAEIMLRNAAAPGQPPIEQLDPAAAAAIAAQAPKRVGLQFLERRRATWDHRKLGRVY